LREVVLEDLGERLALERNDALVELAAVAVVERQREPAVAEQASLAPAGQLALVPGQPADLQLRSAVGDEHLHRALTRAPAASIAAGPSDSRRAAR
jgi:hypothetical protein